MCFIYIWIKKKKLKNHIKDGGFRLWKKIRGMSDLSKVFDFFFFFSKLHIFGVMDLPKSANLRAGVYIPKLSKGCAPPKSEKLKNRKIALSAGGSPPMTQNMSVIHIFGRLKVIERHLLWFYGFSFFPILAKNAHFGHFLGGVSYFEPVLSPNFHIFWAISAFLSLKIARYHLEWLGNGISIPGNHHIYSYLNWQKKKKKNIKNVQKTIIFWPFSAASSVLPGCAEGVKIAKKSKNPKKCVKQPRNHIWVEYESQRTTMTLRTF